MLIRVLWTTPFSPCNILFIFTDCVLLCVICSFFCNSEVDSYQSGFLLILQYIVLFAPFLSPYYVLVLSFCLYSDNCFWTLTVFCHTMIDLSFWISIHRFIVASVHYVWLNVLFILSVYVISVLVAVTVSEVLLCWYWCMALSVLGVHHYATCVHYFYFVGSIIVFLITMLCNCARCLRPTVSFWTAIVDHVGINVYTLRVSSFLTSFVCLNNIV